MKKNDKFKKIILFGIGTMLIFSGKLSDKAIAERTIKLIVDGKDITALAGPIIENNRTLVPIRFISEELGAEVIWNDKDRSIRIEKGDQSIMLRLENHLVEYNNGASYELSDVVPKIVNERAFVPLRLVSNALDIGINWNEINYSVDVDSTKKSDKIPFSDVEIISVNNGQVINGKMDLQINFEEDLKDGKEVRFLLLDPKTAAGFVIAKGEELKSKYSWLPKLEDKGDKILVGSIYDKDGKFIAGDSIPVNINIIPEVKLTGLEEGQTLNKSVSISADINFVASYIKYEITNLDNGNKTITEEQDPQGNFNWNLTAESSGNYSIKVVAYDKGSNPHPSKPINVQVEIGPKLPLPGIPDGVKLIVDGKDITALAGPIIENSRTLVPIRFISEELGAEVIWNDKDRSITIEKEDKSIMLRLESHLVEYNNGASYELSDVIPKIINDRAFVPLRLVSNALDIGINWNKVNFSVEIDSTKKSDKIPFFDVEITTLNNGQIINGKTDLQINFQEDLKDGKEIRFLLLDPKTAKGFVIARGEELKNKYSWLPKLEDKGEKVLVAAIYDKNGKFIAGDSIPVNINIIPKINLTGLKEGQTLDKSGVISADVNFVASYIKYEITNLDNGKKTITEEQDPQGNFNWDLTVESSGKYSIKVIAYDKDSNEYLSKPINVQVKIAPKLSLLGVSSGVTVNKSVSLIASRNFNVIETEYLIKDVKTGTISTLAKMPYGGYKWFPGPEFSGEKELWVRVKDSRGNIMDSEKIKVKLEGSPRLIFQGIGPNQVISEQTKLKVNSNVKLDSVKYIITNKKTGKKRTLSSNVDPIFEHMYSPIQGETTIHAEGIYQGKKVLSEEISFRVYLDKTYGPRPVVEKDKFLGLASKLAKKSKEETGMSASLQTAQAILETGWGQSVPVDKYTGVLSNNLFGIKGKGPAGSVTSNTWEVYNGITYRVDADFRAYNDVNASWTDHKAFLLERERYAQFKLVMHDYTQGAWALKRAGYATDPLYAIKLTRIINQYNLLELDKVGI